MQFYFFGEGATDFAVLENILLGWFADQDEEPYFSAKQPEPYEPGGWTVLKNALTNGKHEEALQQEGNYIVLQIDTDVCDQSGFDVSKSHPDEERQRTAPELIAAVRERLIEWIGEALYTAYPERFLFAIAVEETECWLLPLLASQKSQQGKIVGCLALANKQLKKKNQAPLSTGTNKNVPAYREASKPYRKQKTLLSKGPLNPSLGALLSELESAAIQLDED